MGTLSWLDAATISVQNNGVPLPSRGTINIIGATITDDPVNNRVNAQLLSAGTDFFVIDGASAALAIGDCFTVAASGKITKAVLAALLLCPGVLGVATSAGAPGATITGIKDGVIPPSVSGLSLFIAADIRCNTTTARLEAVSVWSPGDYPVGTANAQGYTLMCRGIVLPAPTPFVPPAGCNVWLKDTGVTTGATFTWTDQSGNLNNATKGGGANQPTVIAAGATGINGLQCVQFSSASSQYLTMASLAALTASDIFVVFKSTAIAGLNSAFWNTSGGAGEFVPFNDNSAYVNAGSTTQHHVTTSALSPDARIAQAWEFISTSTEWTAIQNATQLFTTATNTVSFLAAPTIGLSGSIYGDTMFGEILIFNRKLTGVERANVRAYLTAKWGTP